MRALKPALAGTICAVAMIAAFPTAASAATDPFPTLQPPFTQALYGSASGFFGGVAFASNGDVFVDACQFSNSSLTRFDSHSTLPAQHGTTTLHPSTVVPSAAGCGLTNHPNGSLYSNTSNGVVRLDGTTGAQTGGPFGGAGDALGIAPDPVNGKLAYVSSNGQILEVDPNLTASTVFSTATSGHFIDGIYFDPSGKYLFESDRSPGFHLTVVDRSGALVQSVPLTHEPDGIAFHAGSTKFVVTDSTDGTMSRYDFPGNDFTQPPTITSFATGGFRGDLSQVGPDGCLYVTQAGTRFADGTTSGNNSIVQICPGFSPPVPIPTDLVANPAIAKIVPGLNLYLTPSATLTGAGQPLAGEPVVFTAGNATICTAQTDANGLAKCAGIVPLLQAVIALGYHAAFGGDGAYQPSTATGHLLQVSTIVI